MRCAKSVTGTRADALGVSAESDECETDVCCSGSCVALVVPAVRGAYVGAR